MMTDAAAGNKQALYQQQQQQQRRRRQNIAHPALVGAARVNRCCSVVAGLFNDPDASSSFALRTAFGHAGLFSRLQLTPRTSYCTRIVRRNDTA